MLWEEFQNFKISPSKKMVKLAKSNIVPGKRHSTSIPFRIYIYIKESPCKNQAPRQLEDAISENSSHILFFDDSI